jgi:glycosyltransferase involved in cell wall biosynthesis
MATIALCMIVKDEADNLRKLLPPVKEFFDEIVIVDTGSDDDSVDVAESVGAKIFNFEWIDDFSAARNFAIENTTADWVLSLDADEVVESDSFGLIKELIKTDVDAFKVNVVNHLKNGETVQFKLIRLFRNKPSIRYVGRVHEMVRGAEKVEESDVVVDHRGLLDADLEQKSEFYKGIIGKQLKDTPEDVRTLYLAAQAELNPDKSVAFLRKIALIDPTYKNVWFKIANYELQKGNGKAALVAYEQSLKHNPDSPSAPNAVNNLAVLYAKAGRAQDALSLLESAVTKWPENDALKKNLASLKASL